MRNLIVSSDVRRSQPQPPLDSAMKEVGRLVSPKVKECLGKASESRWNAMQTRDPQRREFWREIDRINIAPTTGFLKQKLRCYMHVQNRFSTASTQSQPA